MATVPQTRQSQLPSATQLVALYTGSMEIRLLAEQLLRRTLDLGRVAINTEVVAARASQHGKPFSVIAKEVSRLANLITDEISSLYESGNRLSAEAVKATAGSRLCEKYAQSLKAGLNGSHNRELMIQTREREGRNLLRVMQQMQAHLQSSLGNARDLSRLAIHIPVIASMFRIEAARAERHLAMAFSGMGDTLVTFNSQLQDELANLLEKASKTLLQLEKATNQGSIYA